MDDVAVTRDGTFGRVRDRKVGFVPACCPKPSRLLLGLSMHFIACRRCAAVVARETNMRCHNLLLAEALKTSVHGFSFRSDALANHQVAEIRSSSGGWSIPMPLHMTGAGMPLR